MKNLPLLSISLISIVIANCTFMTNEERNIKLMVQEFMTAVQNNDDRSAHEILLDLKGFQILNPDVSARMDAESFTDAVLADLVTNYNNFVRYFDGKDIRVTKFHLGSQWYQYKGFPSFKDSQITVKAGNETVEFVIRGIVKIDNKWRIVNLSDNGLF
ncbi:MAG: hypothetical protein FJY65_11585 [Calditrichaeota bacterium]|nr:hypothetical protein [Calditrichota bacterium]